VISKRCDLACSYCPDSTSLLTIDHSSPVGIILEQRFITATSFLATSVTNRAIKITDHPTNSSTTARCHGLGRMTTDTSPTTRARTSSDMSKMCILFAANDSCSYGSGWIGKGMRVVGSWPVRSHDLFDFLFRVSRCMPSAIMIWNGVTAQSPFLVARRSRPQGENLASLSPGVAVPN